MRDSYGVKIADILVLVEAENDTEALNNGVKLYQMLHPDTEEGYLKSKSEVKLLDEWKGKSD